MGHPSVTLVTVKDLKIDGIDGMCNLVTYGHRWSQLVTLVTVEVRDLNNDGLHVYYGSTASN